MPYIHAHDAVNPHAEKSRDWWVFEIQRHPAPHPEPFKSRMRSKEEADYVRSIACSLNDEPQPPAAYADFPKDNEEKHGLILRVIEAFQTGMTRNGGTFPWSGRHDFHLYSTARAFINTIHECQQGILGIYACKELFVYESAEDHPTFHARFELALKVLRESREACLGLVEPSMMQRLAMDPKGFMEMDDETREALRNRPNMHTMALGPREQLRKVLEMRKNTTG